MGEIFDNIGKFMKLRYLDVYPSPDGSYGSYNNKTNGSGMIKEVFHERADIIISPLRMNKNRQQAVQYSVPVFDITTTAIYKKGNPTPQWAMYLKPFSFSSWMLILIGSITLIIVIAIIDGMILGTRFSNTETLEFWGYLLNQATIVQKRLLRLFRNPSLNIGSITVIFDRYDVKSSTKSSERLRRNANNVAETHLIQGGRQVPNYRQFLKSGCNKSSLPKFISQHIVVNHEQLPKERSIILAGGFSDGKLVKEVYEFVVSTIDLLQSHSGKERYIPVHEIVTQVKPIVCECLPAVHAITGCDTTCSFSRIGKRTAYSTLIKNAHTLSDMKRFHEADMDTCISLARKFLRLMYGKKGKHLDSLNDLRFHFAATTDKPASMLPPTEDAFKQHILRAKYQTKIWWESHIANSPLISPVGHGWSS
ncbi:Glutamate receptor ionotropic, kainate 1 [Nymphon striatum]|nr:Glutamate receptor ionotropic, kainate 1 [Nymphon striatum]